MDLTTTVQDLCQDRARAGLAWLQANAETLGLDLNRIDRMMISTRNTHNCVLAQAFGDQEVDGAWTRWHGAIKRAIETGLVEDNGYGFPARGDDDDLSWAQALGFEVDYGLEDMDTAIDDASAEQDQAWRVVLAPYLP